MSGLGITVPAGVVTGTAVVAGARVVTGGIVVGVDAVVTAHKTKNDPRRCCGSCIVGEQ